MTAYPADDDATLYVFDTIVKTYGWDYMKKYMAQKPNFIQGHLEVLRGVANGIDIVTFDSTSSTTGALKRSGRPIDFAFPERDAMPTFFTTAGIFKDAPRIRTPPNSSSIGTWPREQQSRIGTYSARTDVDPPAGLKPLSAYKIEDRLPAIRQ